MFYFSCADSLTVKGSGRRGAVVVHGGGTQPKLNLIHFKRTK